MNVAIIGNCQAEGIALCASAMSPGAMFTFVNVSDLPNGTGDLEPVVKGYDLIFSQSMLQWAIPDAVRGKTRFFPVIAFPAFHPDQCYLRGRPTDGGEVETVTNQMVMYHSAIIVTGYKAGLSVDEVVALFNVESFHRLGYLDRWEAAKRELLAEGVRSGFPLGAMFDRWTKTGCFMYSMNHPALHVYEDIAWRLLTDARIPVQNANVACYVEDPFRKMSIWPVYPGVADRLGLRGDYAFMRGMLQGVLNLREFVEHSFATYAPYERDSLDMLGVSSAEFTAQLGLEPRAEPRPSNKIAGNPYKHVRPEQFWKNSVASVDASALDPVVGTRFTILPTERVATAGSCFAQHIARTLAKSGFNYFVPEQAPADWDAEAAFKSNYGVFSARYGNIYTVRQLVQLLRRVSGDFVPQDDLWLNREGKVVDPFRPQIEPEGFADQAAMLHSRAKHLAAVGRMIREMDVFVFTLGLTEGWRSKLDGAVFAPGVAGGEMDFDRYEFVNFTVEETIADLHEALDLIAKVNPGCRIMLTVSPVPLIATYEPRHALVATTYSKSALRAAADTIYRQYGHVDYFPSYEIITGSFNHGAYFEEDLRNVREEGVAHVMRTFMRHYARADANANVTGINNAKAALAKNQPGPARAAPSRSVLFDIVCDEEAIANG